METTKITHKNMNQKIYKNRHTKQQKKTSF